MATTRATNALKSYIAQSVAKRETVTFDKMVFAHINGLNDATLANINSVPTAGQIKHTANIQQTGYIADDQVVYSVTLGSEIGDFTFNFVGLVNSAKNVLGVAIYTGDIVKTRTKAEEQGNALTRNIILQVNNAKTLTNIQTQAKAWQFDFTDKFLQIKPRKITASTTNSADSSGHTHEVEKASTTAAGVVQLVDNYATADNTKAASANAIKSLFDAVKGLIDGVSRRTTTAQTTATNGVNKADAAQRAATTAQQAANNAQHTANTGVSRADAAQRTANDGVNLANNAQATAANALGRTTARKITASTTNTTDNNGHTHEVEKASTTAAGVVKLNDTLTSNATNEALTARQGKVLSEKIINIEQSLQDFSYQRIGDFEIRRFPDGTMIQTHRFTPPNNRMGTQHKKFSFNWAVAFAEKPKIWIQASGAQYAGSSNTDILATPIDSECTNSTVTFATWEVYFDNFPVSFDFLAIGRWK